MSDNAGDGPNGAALFEAANKLRGSVESAEYKHLVLGLLFLKYISDAFEQRRGELEAELCDPASDSYIEDPEQLAEILEDRDEYAAENVFWVPEEARWAALLAAASQPDIARADRRRARRRSSTRTRACGTCCRASTRARRCRPS